MEFTTWFTYAIAAVLIAVSPGSGAVLSMSHGLAYGVRKASGTVLGLQLGLILVLVVAGAGVGSLLIASELAFSLVKVVGALYLIWLGLSQWRAPINPAVTAPNGELQSAVVPTLGKRILTGFLTNATNPKGILFMVAVLPQFIDNSRPLLPQLAILGATMVVIDVTVMHGYAFLAQSMQRFFRDARSLKAQNRFFGGMLMFMGGALFFVKRA